MILICRLDAGWGCAALTRLGLRATVIDRNPWILNRQLDQDGGNLLIQILRELHMDVLLN